MGRRGGILKFRMLSTYSVLSLTGKAMFSHILDGFGVQQAEVNQSTPLCRSDLGMMRCYAPIHARSLMCSILVIQH